MSFNSPNKNNAGFTLMEILIVIAILAFISPRDLPSHRADVLDP